MSSKSDAPPTVEFQFLFWFHFGHAEAAGSRRGVSTCHYRHGAVGISIICFCSVMIYMFGILLYLLEFLWRYMPPGFYLRDITAEQHLYNLRSANEG